MSTGKNMFVFVLTTVSLALFSYVWLTTPRKKKPIIELPLIQQPPSDSEISDLSEVDSGLDSETEYTLFQIQNHF